MSAVNSARQRVVCAASSAVRPNFAGRVRGVVKHREAAGPAPFVDVVSPTPQPIAAEVERRRQVNVMVDTGSPAAHGALVRVVRRASLCPHGVRQQRADSDPGATAHRRGRSPRLSGQYATVSVWKDVRLFRSGDCDARRLVARRLATFYQRRDEVKP
jgi:hypothetical protein